MAFTKYNTHVKLGEGMGTVLPVFFNTEDINRIMQQSPTGFQLRRAKVNGQDCYVLVGMSEKHAPGTGELQLEPDVSVIALACGSFVDTDGGLEVFPEAS